MPASLLRVAQLGKESNWGTPIAATKKLAGVLDSSLVIEDQVEALPSLGIMAPSQAVANVGQHGSGSLQRYVTFEEIIYELSGLFGTPAPSGGNPYTWNYAAPVGAMTTPQKFTMEFGAAGAAYKLAGALVSKLVFALEAQSFWKVTSDWVGKAISTVSLAALSEGTTTVPTAAQTTLYLDAWDGTMGGTPVAATLISAELTADAGRHVKYFAGSSAPTDHGERQWQGGLKLTADFNATAKAVVDALIAPALVQRQIRLKAVSGTNVFQLDFAGTINAKPKLFEDRDGDMTVALEFIGTHHTSFGSWLKAVVTNGVSSLT